MHAIRSLVLLTDIADTLCILLQNKAGVGRRKGAVLLPKVRENLFRLVLPRGGGEFKKDEDENEH